MNTKRIVITGGPGTGKTSVIEKLEEAGHYCFHEIIRSMTLEAKKNGKSEEFVSNPIISVSDPIAFNKMLLEGRVKHFKEADDLKEEQVFYDRGIPDVLAYMDYFKQSYTKDFIEVCRAHTYDLIFILPPWEAIYISDNERMESYTEAKEIHTQLEQTYHSMGYKPITVPKGTVEERLTFILNHIKPI